MTIKLKRASLYGIVQKNLSDIMANKKIFNENFIRRVI